MDGATVSSALSGKSDSGHTHNYAASSHNHSASNITSGTLPIARGGTGATTQADALKALGLLYEVHSHTEPGGFGWWTVSPKSGYRLLNAYFSNDGSDQYITAIDLRSDGQYTIFYNKVIPVGTVKTLHLFWMRTS